MIVWADLVSSTSSLSDLHMLTKTLPICPWFAHNLSPDRCHEPIIWAHWHPQGLTPAVFLSLPEAPSYPQETHRCVPSHQAKTISSELLGTVGDTPFIYECSWVSHAITFSLLLWLVPSTRHSVRKGQAAHTTQATDTPRMTCDRTTAKAWAPHLHALPDLSWASLEVQLLGQPRGEGAALALCPVSWPLSSGHMGASWSQEPHSGLRHTRLFQNAFQTRE